MKNILTQWARWGIYSLVIFLLLIPFYSNIGKHICLALIMGLFAGILNEIYQELRKK